MEHPAYKLVQEIWWILSTPKSSWSTSCSQRSPTLVVFFWMERPTHQTLDGKTYLHMQYFTPIKWPTETNGSAVDLCEFHSWNSCHFLAGSLLSNSMVTWSYSMSCYGFIYNEQIVGNPSSSWKKYKGFGPSEKTSLIYLHPGSCTASLILNWRSVSFKVSFCQTGRNQAKQRQQKCWTSHTSPKN